MSALVDSSCPANASSSREIAGAIWSASCLPSSTPHWSNESMPQTMPCVNVMCSYSAISCPTTSIMAPALTPSVVGQLIALYEHITFTQGIVWGIDSFDQWGVELGKQLALQIAGAISRDDEALAGQDESTKALITYYRTNRS